MATDVVMPQMGESIAEGTIVRWIKKVGDKVDRDEPLFEISTDKVDAEIPSPAAGVVSEIRVKEGETVPVNSVVAVIGAAGDAAAAPAAEAAAPDRDGATAAASPAPHDAPQPPKPAPQADGADCATAPADRNRRRPRQPLPQAVVPARAGDAAPVASRPRRPTEDADPRAIVAAGPQDREGTQRRHRADSAAPASPAA